MKSLFNTLILLMVLSSCLCSFQCKKKEVKIDTSLHTITLYDKPLKVIQAYITGTWKLEYQKGGICGTCVYPSPPNNSLYMIISPRRITFQSDSLGVFIDTLIYWKKDTDIYGHSTYLLTYHYTPGYAFPYAYIVYGIKNDSLILMDDASDAVSSVYTRSD